MFLSGFGFNIRGGVDHPHVGSDPGIFITTIKADSVAGRDGRLEPGDRILAVSKTWLSINEWYSGTRFKCLSMGGGGGGMGGVATLPFWTPSKLQKQMCLQRAIIIMELYGVGIGNQMFLRDFVGSGDRVVWTHISCPFSCGSHL